MSNSVEYITEVGTIRFMAVAKPMRDKEKEKDIYSVKLCLPTSDPIYEMLKKDSPKKIDTKNNIRLEGTGTFEVNFSTGFAPTAVDVDGTEVSNTEFPFFDSRIDEGTARVAFKVVDYGDKKIVALSGVRLISLELAERDEQAPLSDTLDKLRNL